MVQILVVEDEPFISGLIEMTMIKAGYDCRVAHDGRRAADILESTDFDLVLLDIMLPEIDGYELMEYIRPLNIPVIFITAKGQVGDRVKGLRMGADDYIVKPFDVDELLARVDAVLRRYNKGTDRLEAGGVSVDVRARVVRRDGRPVTLAPREYDLLVDLMRNRGMALYRETLYERVWQEDYTGNSRTLDLHIQRLRRKLGWQEVIRTVHRIGYMLDV